MGSLASLPVLALMVLRSRFTGSAVTGAHAFNVMATTAAVGTATLTTMGGYKVSQLPQEGIEDRVYRLHFNEKVARVREHLASRDVRLCVVLTSSRLARLLLSATDSRTAVPSSARAWLPPPRGLVPAQCLAAWQLAPRWVCWPTS